MKLLKAIHWDVLLVWIAAMGFCCCVLIVVGRFIAKIFF